MSENKYYREVTINHPYFKTQKHFINYCTKFATDKSIEHNILLGKNIKLLSWCLANNTLFLRNGIDLNLNGFTYQLKEYDIDINNTNLSIADKLLKVIDEINMLYNRKINISDCVKLYEQFPLLDELEFFDNLSKSGLNYEKEFLELMSNLNGKSGIYFLFDLNKELIYIGKSYNLMNRIHSSSKERKAFYCKVMVTSSEADANILEPYYIGLLCPVLNSDLKSLNKPTFKIEHGYCETDFVKIYSDDQPFEVKRNKFEY